MPYKTSLILMLSILFSCNIDSTGKPKPKYSLEGQFTTINDAIVNLFRNYQPKTKCSKWICNTKEIADYFPNRDTNLFISKILAIDSGNILNTSKTYYILAETKPITMDCHACSPIQEIYILTTVDNRLKLIYHNVFSQMGSWGTSPDFYFAKIGLNKLALFFTPGYTLEGYTVEHLAGYSFVNNQFLEILKIENAFMDNTGNCDSSKINDCWRYEYKLNIANSDKEYFDIILHKKGTLKSIGDKIIPIDSTCFYIFSNGKYKPFTR